MGYYTYHTMYAKAKTLTPELVEEINKWLKERGTIGYALYEGELTTDWRDSTFAEWEPHGEVKWYDHHEDMEALSKAFPEVTFCLHGDGEEKHDEWDEYWLNGDCERCQAEVHIPEPTRIKW